MLIFSSFLFAAVKIETNRNFGAKEKSAYGLARFSGRGYSRLPPRKTRLGLGGGFPYYMEERRQGLRRETE